MEARVARYPELHTVPENPSARPELRASRCRECGHLSFPARRFGCPACGAPPDSAEEARLAGDGTLDVFTVVHRGPGPDTPYAVGRVQLEAGIEVDAILAPDSLEDLAPGQSVKTCLVAVGEDEAGATLVECRFRPEASG